MDSKELRLTVKFGNDGQLYINNMTALNFFGSKNKSTSAILEIKVLSKNASEAMCGYFRSFILPEFRKAIRENGENLTLAKTEDFISEITPQLQKEIWSDELKGYVVEYLRFEDLSNYDGSHCISHLKIIAATEYGFNIDDEMFTNN